MVAALTGGVVRSRSHEQATAFCQKVQFISPAFGKISMKFLYLAIVLAATIALPVEPVRAQSPDMPAQAVEADPAHLAAAEEVVAQLVPEGVYARMMRDQMPAMMEAMMAEMMNMPASDLGEGESGRPMAEVMREMDPHFEERTRIATAVMYEELGVLMTEMEPAVRSGLSRAFARKFTIPQLADMNAFFATPSGKAFADEFLMLFVDPEMTREMASLAPRMMQAMPAITEKMEAATAHLPPPPEAESEDQ